MRLVITQRTTSFWLLFANSNLIAGLLPGGRGQRWWYNGEGAGRGGMGEEVWKLHLKLKDEKLQAFVRTSELSSQTYFQMSNKVLLLLSQKNSSIWDTLSNQKMLSISNTYFSFLIELNYFHINIHLLDFHLLPSRYIFLKYIMN